MATFALVVTFIVAFFAGVLSASIESAHRRRLDWLSSDPISIAVFSLAVLGEGAVACGLAVGIDAATKFPPAVVGVVAGFGTPTILHQRFVSGTDWGLERLYLMFGQWVDETLEDRSGRRYSAWVPGKLFPTLLEHHQLSQLAERLDIYVTEKFRANKVRKVKAVQRIDQVLADTDAGEEKQLKALIKLARELEAHGVLKDLYRGLIEARAARRRRMVRIAIAAAVLLTVGGVVVLAVWQPFEDGLGVLKVKAPRSLLLYGHRYRVTAMETTGVVAGHAADKTYLLLKMLVGNESDKAVRMDVSEFSLQTPSGEVQHPVRAQELAPRLVKADFKPDDRKRGILAFDVSRDDLGDLTLGVQPPPQKNRDTPTPRSGLIELRLSKSSPHLLPKSFHGRGGRKRLRVAFQITPRLVKRIVIRGRRGRLCRPTGTAAVHRDGRFRYEDSNGLTFRGRFLSTLQAHGDVSQPRGRKRARCLTQRRRLRWSALARP